MAKQKQSPEELVALFDSCNFDNLQLFVDPHTSQCTVVNKETGQLLGNYAGGTFKAMLTGCTLLGPYQAQDVDPISLKAV